MKDERESRYKLFMIDTGLVLAMLNWNDHQFIALPITKGLPDEAIVEAVNYDVQRNCFLARVYHDSFDVVPIGVMIPVSNGGLDIEERVVSVEQYTKAYDEAHDN
jgi:hypothetical protein